MMMLTHLGIESFLARGHAQTLDHSLGREDLQVPVHGSETYMGQALLDIFIDIGSTWMVNRLFDLIKDYPPLLGHPEFFIVRITTPFQKCVPPLF